MVQVCEGARTKNDMLVQSIDQYKDVFIRARAEFAKVIQVRKSSMTPFIANGSMCFLWILERLKIY
jgi:DNA topoisomerase-3